MNIMSEMEENLRVAAMLHYRARTQAVTLVCYAGAFFLFIAAIYLGVDIGLTLSRWTE